MYIEEGILKSRIKEDDRCVFTLEQARHLPYDNQNANIYIPLMVEKTYMQLRNNTSLDTSIEESIRKKTLIFLLKNSNKSEQFSFND
jgi:hypothetical protein